MRENVLLNNKVKLAMCKNVEFKKYLMCVLHVMCMYLWV